MTIRQPRADAVRNRERVLRAGLEVFSERGRDAQIEDVAQCAGVGVGTVYRHFETKEALLDALLIARFAEVRAALMAATASPSADPWSSFAGAMRSAAEFHARDRAFADVISEQVCKSTALAPIMAELDGAWGALIDRGKAAGVLRADLDPSDMRALMCGLARVVASSPSRAAWERYLEIVLDGLRAG
ncbi:MAG: TetR/AcrR family transcriptional regulator [Solirubrobacteraceae bacterium]